MPKYDTAAIRRLAQRIDATAEDLSNVNQNATRQITSINDTMQGETIKAIDSTVDKLNEELSAIRNGLAKCANTLYAYARELDIADERAKELINSN